MLVFIALVAFATFVGTEAYPLSFEDKEKLFSYHTECQAESGVDEEVIAKFCSGEQLDDPKLKDYLFCVSKKLGFQNEGGELQIEVIKTKLLKLDHNATEIDKLVEKCAVQKEMAAQTAFDVFKCYRENVPNYDGLLYVVTITPIKLRKLLKYRRECMEETNVDEELIKKTRKGEFPEIPIFKSYLLCISKKIGFQDAEGKVQRDVIAQKLGEAVKEVKKVEKLVELCVSEKELPEDTAHAMMKCFCEKSYINFLPPIALPPEKMEKLFTYHKECKKQTSVNKTLLIEASVGNFTEDAALKEYFLCMSKNVGFQNEEGELQKEVLRQKIEEALKDPLVSQQLLEQCAVQKESPAETAFSTVKCYFENTPNHISLFKNASLTAEKIEKLSKFNTECMTESGVDSETMEQAKKSIFSETEKFKNHLFCFFKKLGLQNEAGELQTKRLYCKFGKLLGDPALSEKLVEKCGLQMDTPTDTAYKAFACYYENSPSNFNVFSLF